MLKDVTLYVRKYYRIREPANLPAHTIYQQADPTILPPVYLLWPAAVVQEPI